MPPQTTRPPEPSGIPAMLLVMSSLTLVATVMICALLGYEDWWLLPVALGAVLFGAVICALTVARALGDANHDLPGRPAPEEAPAPVAATPGAARDDHAARRRPAPARPAVRS